MTTNEANIAHRKNEAAPERYPVNLRCRIPFYPRSLFVTLIVGQEKRSLERLTEERMRYPLDTMGNVTCAFLLGMLLSTALFYCVLTLLS